MIAQVIFYIAAVSLLLAAWMVVVSRNPVRSVLFLVACFLLSSVLWILLQAEFLALVLIFVYVGAVMTLFLFVVMMLNIDVLGIQARRLKNLPLSLLVLGVLLATVFVMLHAILPGHVLFVSQAQHVSLHDSNTQQLGILLYTHYLFCFELAGLLLVIAIIGSISLAYFGRKPNTRTQDLAAQHAVSKAERLKVVDVPASPKVVYTRSGKKQDEESRDAPE